MYALCSALAVQLVVVCVSVHSVAGNITATVEYVGLHVPLPSVRVEAI